MLDAARESASSVAGKRRVDLETDRVLLLACSRLLEILGEAASQVSPGFQAVHRGIPWPKIIGMRNRLIHAYFDINLDVLWETLEAELPPLIRALEGIPQREGS